MYQSMHIMYHSKEPKIWQRKICNKLVNYDDRVTAVTN